jgi:hypothetical protein
MSPMDFALTDHQQTIRDAAVKHCALLTIAEELLK